MGDGSFWRPDSSGTDDNDFDTLSNLVEYGQQTNPLDYYNGQAPVLSLLDGDNQTGAPGTILPQPFTVRVTSADGTPLVNAPVRFGPAQGGGSLSASEYGSSAAAIIDLRTDSAGAISVWHILPDTPDTSVFTAVSAGLGAATVQVTFTAHTSTASTTAPAAPGKPVITLQNEESEALVEWADNSNNETAFYIERTEDGANWTRRATLPPNTTAWTDRDLTPGWAYIYRVVAHN